jgi:hypothetical protein
MTNKGVGQSQQTEEAEAKAGGGAALAGFEAVELGLGNVEEGGGFDEGEVVAEAEGAEASSEVEGAEAGAKEEREGVAEVAGEPAGEGGVLAG